MMKDDTVRGRLLRTSLEAIDRADAAQTRVESVEQRTLEAQYLTALDRELLRSLDTVRTEETIARVALPEAGAWAIVDLISAAGVMRRLAIAHPDNTRHAAAELLSSRWHPEAGDPIGAPALREDGAAVEVVDDLESVLEAAAHSTDDLALLQQLGFAACLIVPMRTEDELLGAITFVSIDERIDYSSAELAIAGSIAHVSAHALRNAALFATVDSRRSSAEASISTRSQALGRLTHELRTPLAAIGGYVDLLRLGLRGPVTADQNKDLDRIKWNQNHLLGLITDILGFVRLDTRQVKFEIADVDLDHVVSRTAEMLGPIFRTRNQEVVAELTGIKGRFVRADAARLRQIAINLVTNASKYSPDGSRVLVRCGIMNEIAYMEVVDSGPGIEPEQQACIFEPFVQLGEENPSRQGGVGLGLAIARQFARGMGGDVTVISIVGKGSTFRLTLPMSGGVTASST